MGKRITEKERKDDTIIKMRDGRTFVPSSYQRDIFDKIEHTPFNIIIEAAAGSAKTTTLLKCIDLLPNDKNILFVAFNKDVVEDIKKKIGHKKNVSVRTLHSLGYSILNRFLENKTEIDYYKYNSIINDIVDKNEGISLSKMKLIQYKKNIKALSDFGRFNMASSVKEMNEICKIHNIECVSDEIEIALKAMEYGKEDITSIDYTDMVWLPNILMINNIWNKYDYIFLDEAQDSNIAEYELIMKCFKMGTRFVCAGDENQQIYSFCGSSIEALNKYKKLPNTICLPLSISYRCPKKIIDFAKKFTKKIEASPNAIEGIIGYEKHIRDIKDGDAVLCRNNAPLMKVYVELLKDGKKAFIMGSDIGENLINKVVHTGEKNLNPSMLKEGVFRSLYNEMFDARDKLMDTSNIDEDTANSSPLIASMYDSIQALEILSSHTNNSKELIKIIKNIFSDNTDDGIILSTCHKAKGREFDNVFICCDSLMPSKCAKQEWEKKQEKNLQYVAYTRSKKSLYFLSEKGFEMYLNNSSSMFDKAIKDKEIIFNKLSGRKKRKIVINKDNFEDILKTQTKINEKDISGICITLKDKKAEENAFGVLNTLKNRKKIKL